MSTQVEKEKLLGLIESVIGLTLDENFDTFIQQPTVTILDEALKLHVNRWGKSLLSERVDDGARKVVMYTLSGMDQQARGVMLAMFDTGFHCGFQYAESKRLERMVGNVPE